MDILGISIETVEARNKRTLDHEIASSPGGSIYISRRVLDSEYFKSIIWPNPDHLNDFEKVSYAKIIADFAEGIDKGTGFFSICDVRKMCSLCGVEITPRTKPLLDDNLTHLHCVNYRDIPAHLRMQILMLLTAIFTEGRQMGDLEVTEQEEQDAVVDVAEVIQLISHSGQS